MSTGGVPRAQHDEARDDTSFRNPWMLEADLNRWLRRETVGTIITRGGPRAGHDFVGVDRAKKLGLAPSDPVRHATDPASSASHASSSKVPC